MKSARHLATATVLALLSAPASPAAASASANGFDDPKLEREWAALRASLDLARPSASPLARRAPAAEGGDPGRPSGSSERKVAERNVPERNEAVRNMAARSLPGATRSSTTPPLARSSAHDPSESPQAADTRSGEWPYRPRLKASYRRFSLAALPSSAASGTAAAAASAPASEPFESVSLEVYPMSGYLRTGTAAQFGWQSGGQSTGGGDYFIAQSFSSGFQLPGRFTPFAEAMAGGGYMRRVLPDTSLAAAYWQVGFEGGLEIYLAGRAYTSVAVGYLRTGNLLLLDGSPTSLKQNTWALKVGLGI